jgi:hypothetical protein
VAIILWTLASGAGSSVAAADILRAAKTVNAAGKVVEAAGLDRVKPTCRQGRKNLTLIATDSILIDALSKSYCPFRALASNLSP